MTKDNLARVLRYICEEHFQGRDEHIKEYTIAANGSGQIVIQYVNGASDNAKSSGIEILPLLAAPTGLTATLTSNGQVELSWAASTNATSYNSRPGSSAHPIGRLPYEARKRHDTSL